MCSTNAQDEALDEVEQEPAARKLPGLKHFCFHRQELLGTAARREQPPGPGGTEPCSCVWRTRLLPPRAALPRSTTAVLLPQRPEVQRSLWEWIYLLRASPSTPGKRGHLVRGREIVYGKMGAEVSSWGWGETWLGEQLRAESSQQWLGQGHCPTAHACPGPTADPTSPRTGAGAGGMWLQQHLGATKPVATPAPANPYPSHCALLQASSSKGQRLPSCTHTSLGSTGSRQLRPRSSLQELLGTPWGCSPAFCSKKACAGASSGCSCHPPPPVES